MRSPKLPMALCAYACALAFTLLTSTAWAEPLIPETLPGPWALPLFAGDGLFVLGVGFAFAHLGWKRLGLMLWLALVTAGGCFLVYGMAYAAVGPPWQPPAFIVGALLFIFAAEHARQRLSGE